MPCGKPVKRMGCSGASPNAAKACCTCCGFFGGCNGTTDGARGPSGLPSKPCARNPGSCTAIPSNTGAAFFRKYASLTHERVGKFCWLETWNTAFHCTKRAGGQFTLEPEPLVYGPDHGLQ